MRVTGIELNALLDHRKAHTVRWWLPGHRSTTAIQTNSVQLYWHTIQIISARCLRCTWRYPCCGNIWGFRCFLLSRCWFEVSMYPEGPVTGHPDTGFLVFPLSSSRFWKGFQFPSWGLCCSGMSLSVVLLVTEHNYQHTTHNTSEERRPRLHDDGKPEIWEISKFLNYALQH
jgi:hypothetical protein